MTVITLKDRSAANITLSNATENDIESLLFLNKKWQRKSLEDIKNGYIGAEFSKQTFQELINKGQVICAYSDGQVIGYYLLNNVSKDGIIGTHEEIVITLRNTGKIEGQLKICVGAQVVVDSYFMGSLVRKLMLEKLGQNMKGKYDYLFGTIAKDNTRAFTAHTRDGWEVVGGDENIFYVIFKV